jgi:hypothetical protein
LLSTVQEAYRLLFEAKMAWHKAEVVRLRLAAKRLLESVVGRIDEKGELK